MARRAVVAGSALTGLAIVLAACGVGAARELPPLRTPETTVPPPTVAINPFAPDLVGSVVDSEPDATPAPTSADAAPPSAPESGPDSTSASNAPTTVPVAVPVPTSPPGTFSIIVTGDLMGHIPIVDRASANTGGAGYDFAPMFRTVEPTISAADLAICHLETPIAPPGTEIDPVPPEYGIPAEMAVAIASAGYDRCSLASNHSMDKGSAGIDATLNALDAAGVGHSGMARTPAESASSVIDVAGVPVTHLSYTFSYNGRPAANGESWRSNLIDPDRIVADARAARADGARFVIVSVHWGAEGSTAVLPDQRGWAEEITASGAVDLIVGHHAHVVQPIEQVNGTWVVFGLGNFLTAMSDTTKCCGIRGQDGMMVRIQVAIQADGTFSVAQPQVIPTYVDRSDYTIVPVNAALAGEIGMGALDAGALTDSLDRTRNVVGPFIVER